MNLHVRDVGSSLIFGPVGTGKSTLLAFLAAQFRRYPNASIFCFDKGMSMYTLCKAAQGTHYHVALSRLERERCPANQIECQRVRAWEQLTGNGYKKVPARKRPDLDSIELDFSAVNF